MSRLLMIVATMCAWWYQYLGRMVKRTLIKSILHSSVVIVFAQLHMDSFATR